MPIVLVSPRIAPNTGNIIRLCANVGAQLHLVEPLGFHLDDASLRRAGLDYHDLTRVHVHPDLATCLGALGEHRRLAFSSRGSVRYDTIAYRPSDVLVFGTEPTGLPDAILQGFAPEHVLRLPMRPANRSLNLANAVAVVVYEAWRQQGFAGDADPNDGVRVSEQPPNLAEESTGEGFS